MRSLLRSKRLVQIAPYVLLCGILLGIPGFASKYIMGITAITLMYAIGTMSLDLLMGYTGLLSLGHGVGWGMGSYTVGVLVSKGVTENFWIVLGVAVLLALIANAVFGLLALRTYGIYFGFITLTFSELLRVTTLKWTSFLGGENGLSGIHKPWSLGDTPYYYLVLGIFIICFLIMRRLTNSWFGRVLVGIRENESRVIMLGYNTWAFKYFIFIISGAFAAIGGALSCYYYGIAAPDHFSLLIGGTFIFGTLLGGKGTLVGPVIGTAIIVFASNYLSTYTQNWMLLLGLMFVLVVMFFEKGIGGYLIEWLHSITLARPTL